MAKALTDAQYKFVMEVLAGKTREAAYATAYPKSRKWSRSVRDSTASKLIRSEAVWAFYDSERQKMADALAEETRIKGVWNRQKSIEALALVVGLAVQDAKDGKRKRDSNPDNARPIMTSTIASAIIKGVCELNRMLDCETATMAQGEPVRIIDDYQEGE